MASLKPTVGRRLKLSLMKLFGKRIKVNHIDDTVREFHGSNYRVWVESVEEYRPLSNMSYYELWFKYPFDTYYGDEIISAIGEPVNRKIAILYLVGWLPSSVLEWMPDTVKQNGKWLQITRKVRNVTDVTFKDNTITISGFDGNENKTHITLNLDSAT